MCTLSFDWLSRLSYTDYCVDSRKRRGTHARGSGGGVSRAHCGLCASRHSSALAIAPARAHRVIGDMKTDMFFSARESDDRRVQIKAVYYTVYRLRRIRRSARALPLLGRVAAHGWWAGLWAAEAGPRDKHMVPQRRCAALASDMRRGRQHMRAHPLRQRDFVLGRDTPALKDSCCSISARAEVRQATPVRRVA